MQNAWRLPAFSPSCHMAVALLMRFNGDLTHLNPEEMATMQKAERTTTCFNIVRISAKFGNNEIFYFQNSHRNFDMRISSYILYTFFILFAGMCFSFSQCF